MRINAKRWGLRFSAVAGLVAALVVGATLVAPGVANADVGTLSRRPFGQTTYILVFSVANDTNTTLTSWKMEFDLPPGGAVQGIFTFDIKVTRTGQHFILENNHPVTIGPGYSATYSIPILGLAWPTNCVTRGTPCALDTQAPSTPPNLRIDNLRPYIPTGTYLLWSMSTDNVGVAGYEIFRNGVLVRTWGGGPYELPSADSGAVYGVRAFDDMGNRSAIATAVYP